MYKDDIKVLKSQKRESLILVLYDIGKLYIKMKIGYPNLKEELVNLIELLKQYIEYDNNEIEVLNEINKKYGMVENNDIIDILLQEFDEIYENYYYYIQKCLYDYELVLDDNIINLIINRINGKYLKVNNEKYRLILPKIDKLFTNDYKVKVLKKIRSI